MQAPKQDDVKNKDKANAVDASRAEEQAANADAEDTEACEHMKGMLIKTSLVVGKDEGADVIDGILKGIKFGAKMVKDSVNSSEFFAIKHGVLYWYDK